MCLCVRTCVPKCAPQPLTPIVFEKRSFMEPTTWCFTRTVGQGAPWIWHLCFPSLCYSGAEAPVPVRLSTGIQTQVFMTEWPFSHWALSSVQCFFWSHYHLLPPSSNRKHTCALMIPMVRAKDLLAISCCFSLSPSILSAYRTQDSTRIRKAFHSITRLHPKTSFYTVSPSWLWTDFTTQVGLEVAIFQPQSPPVIVTTGPSLKVSISKVNFKSSSSRLYQTPEGEPTWRPGFLI